MILFQSDEDLIVCHIELRCIFWYFDDLKSDIADFKNSGSRYGGTSAAALFLKKFIKDTPWAHIDIAGTSILNKSIRELPKGASGVGVRTLIKYICN